MTVAPALAALRWDRRSDPTCSHCLLGQRQRSMDRPPHTGSSSRGALASRGSKVVPDVQVPEREAGAAGILTGAGQCGKIIRAIN